MRVKKTLIAIAPQTTLRAVKQSCWISMLRAPMDFQICQSRPAKALTQNLRVTTWACIRTHFTNYEVHQRRISQDTAISISTALHEQDNREEATTLPKQVNDMLR